MDSEVIKVKGERLKVKGLIFLSIFIFQFSFYSCKENNWLDWKTQNEIWLEQNRTRAGVIETESGLQYKIIKDPVPQDARPNETSTIVCDYTVKLINDYVVSSGKGVSIYLPNTIPGFKEGCHKIHSHGDIELYIPAFLGYDNEKYTNDKYDEAEGYGTEGTTGYIPPYSTLIYKIHICSVTSN